jgi:hypothetical protein
MSDKKMMFRDSQVAFAEAISKGILSASLLDSNYAGLYMYMYTDASGDHFKNRNTRKYLSVTRELYSFPKA